MEASDVLDVVDLLDGTVAGREVWCASVEQQVAMHQGYELRPVDHADLARLRALIGRE